MISYYYIAILATMVAIMATYLDRKLFNSASQKGRMKAYLKSIILANLVVAIIWYIMQWIIQQAPQSGGAPLYQPIEGPSVYLPDIGEEILSGVPTF